METLYDRELEQLRAALAETAPTHITTGRWNSETSPDSPLMQDVAAWVERACAALPDGHPLRLRRS